MAITNINNDHFDSKQIEEGKALANKFFALISTKTRNLSPQERKDWGSINEQNKLVTLKALELANNQPELRSPDIDYKELQADWDDRMFLAGLISQLEDVIRIADNVRITHDWDAYQSTRQDYRHAEYMLNTDRGAAFENKYEILKDFFITNPKGAGASSPATDTATPETTAQ